MWSCPNCEEQLEDQFDSCWKCADKKAVRGTRTTIFTKREKYFTSTIIGAIFFIVFVVPFGFGFLTHTIYKLSSPAAGIGIACFFEESDAMLWVDELYVKDYKISKFEFIHIGTTNYLKSGPPKKAVWSTDGTIVAVVGNYVHDSQNAEPWTHAYDFLLHRSYNETTSGASKIIKELLISRGDKGVVILSNEESFKSLSRPCYPWELFQLSNSK